MKKLFNITELKNKLGMGISKEDIIKWYKEMHDDIIPIEFQNDTEAKAYIEGQSAEVLRPDKDIIFIEQSESLQQINVFCTFKRVYSPSYDIKFTSIIGIGTIRQFRDIWQNDNPSASITTSDYNILTDDIYQFDYFILYYKIEASASTLSSIPIYYKSETIQKPATTEVNIIGGARNGGNSNAIARREIVIQLVNKKLVCNVCYNAAGTQLPQACIPIKLVGVR